MNITIILGVVTILVILYSVQVTAQLMGEVQEAMRCVEKLMPCHSYIYSSVSPPPSCCAPMKEIAERDVNCLCDAFNHPNMLRFIDLTKEDALNLLSSCGVDHNVTLCTKTDSSSSGSTSNGNYSACTKKSVVLAVILSALLEMIFF